MYRLTIAAAALLATLVSGIPADDLNKRAGYVCSRDALASTLSSSKYSAAASSFCSSYIRPKVTLTATKVVSVTNSATFTPPPKTATVVNTITSTQTSTASASVTNTITSTKTNVFSSTVVNTVTVVNTATATSTMFSTITETKVVATFTSTYGNKIDNTHYQKRATVAPSTNSAGYPTFIAATYKPSVVSASCSCLITPQALKTSTISTTKVSTATVKQTTTASPSTVTKTITATTTKGVVGATVTKTLTASYTLVVSSTATRTLSAATITQMVTSTLVRTGTTTAVLSTTSVLPSPKDVYCNVAGVTNGANLITDGWDIASSPSECMSLCRGASGCDMMHFGCPNSDGCYCGLYSSDDLGQSYYMGSGNWGSAYTLWDALCDVDS